MDKPELKPAIDERRELRKLKTCRLCFYHIMMHNQWNKPALWLVNRYSACDECILRIAREYNGEWLLPALTDIAQRHLGEIVKFETPIDCESHLLVQEDQYCTMFQAHWRIGGFAKCDYCITELLEHQDNREWLTKVIDDLSSRYQKVPTTERLER